MSVKVIDDLKNAMPLLDFISAYYPDVKQHTTGGKTFVCCPHHEEDTPSCLINENGDGPDTFKCFSCNASGTIIDFVGAIEKVDVTPGTEEFRSVCKQIGDRVGVKVEFTPPNPSHEAYKIEMDEHVLRYYAEFKNNPQAVEYLKNERHLTRETIIKFRLGCTPTDEYKYRKKGNISNRISFPIFEMTGRTDFKCVAMAYRALSKTDEGPKYINDANLDGRTGQDPNLAGLFTKGQFLYGYPQAYKSIIKDKSVVVVEGYMDVISLHQAGITNTVGCMGTALTSEQMDILRRLTSNIYLFLDGDEAGINNMMRVLPQLLEKGFNVKIINGTNGRDPADICVDMEFEEKRVRDYFRNNCESAIMKAINQACKSYEEVALKERAKALRSVTPILDVIQNDVDKSLYEQQIKKRLDLIL